MVAPDGTFIEETGEVGEPIIPRLRDLSPALIVCPYPDRFLLEAHEHWGSDPDWNWRVVPQERQLGAGENAQLRLENLVSYLGWRTGKRTHYHHPISPIQYGRLSLHELDGQSYVERLYRWASELRRFARRHSLKVSPTMGGMAAQLLRDKRFYGSPRRKVPTATNERARPHLPGNFYELQAKRGCVHAAAYVIDQEAAHHSAASEIPLPDADTLYARGNWRKPDSENCFTKDWPNLDIIGLVKVYASIPAHIPNRWLPAEWKRPGERPLYLYTNELEFLTTLGIEFYGVIAAWGSETIDQGITRYARWAKGERSGQPKWLKGTTLAAYGVLGARPRQLASAYRKAKRGDSYDLWLEHALVDSRLVTTKRAVQLPVANVIQRGMIEAETRLRSIRLARELESHNITVHAIQADAVICDGRQNLPLIPHPFRIKQRLQWVRFNHLQSFDGQEVEIRTLKFGTTPVPQFV